MASLDEMGLGATIEPYTGIPSIDWILNHHMTPLFTMFVATAIFRYLYSAGLIFPLDESDKISPAPPTTATPPAPDAGPTSSTTTPASTTATTTTTTTTTTNNNNLHAKDQQQTTGKNKVDWKDKAKAKASKNKANTNKAKAKQEFTIGICCVASNNVDRFARQQTTILSIKKVKGVQVVMNPRVGDPQPVQAVYVSSDDTIECCAQIQSFLAAKIHVVIDCPVAFSRKELQKLRVLARTQGVYLLQLAPSRFVASWERMFSSVHAEAGDVVSVHMEYETGPMPRCLERVWNVVCRCTCCCCGPCSSVSYYKRSRATAAPTLADATKEGLSLLHELLSDITNTKQMLEVVQKKNETKKNTTDTHALCLAGRYGGGSSGGSSGSSSGSSGSSSGSSGSRGNDSTQTALEWSYRCQINSWKCLFPKALIRVVGSESNVLYQYYDSIDGNQVVQVTSKHGFSHTDRVADLYDAWTMSIVAFVRAIKFNEDLTNMLESTEMVIGME